MWGGLSGVATPALRVRGSHAVSSRSSFYILIKIGVPVNKIGYASVDFFSDEESIGASERARSSIVQ
jgi:hypothetical protein